MVRSQERQPAQWDTRHSTTGCRNGFTAVPLTFSPSEQALCTVRRLQLLHRLDELGGLRLAVAVQHPRVIQIEQRVLDS